MKSEFVKKVVNEGVVDTRKYRYATRERGDHLDIIRLPIDDLDTTAAINGWEKVCEVR